MHELTEAQQRVAVSLIRERDGIVAMANRQVAEINKALEATAYAFASQAGLDGEWRFDQETPGGTIGLSEKGGDPGADSGEGAVKGTVTG